MAQIPDPPSPFAEEGLPDMGYELPSKAATGDPQEGIEPPHDEPMAVDDYGTTASEEAAGEPLDLRLTREEPEVLDSLDDGRDPLDDEGGDSPTPGSSDYEVGRLVQPDEGAGPDLESDAVATSVGTDTGGATAEEAAMHLDRELG